MKKKLYYILIIANIISLILILQIVFGVIGTIECSFSQSRIDLINNFTVDISIGIILSSLFYYLLVYIPEYKRIKTTRLTNTIYLRRIANRMQLVIGYVSQKCSLKCEGEFYEKIDSEEFDKISGIRIGGGVNYCEYTQTMGKDQYSFADYIDTYNMQIFKDEIINGIDEICNSPNAIYEDEDLIWLLCRIKRCIFFMYIDDIEKEIRNKNYDYTPFQDNVLREYYHLYVSLLKYISPFPIKFTKIN